MNGNGLKDILKKFKLNERLISRLLGILVLVVIGVLIFNYFKGFDQDLTTFDTGEEELGELTDQKVELVEDGGKLVPAGLPREYTVQSGEDLWKIAERYYSSGYNWVDVAKENGLNNPNQIAAGQKLTLPKVEAKQPTATTGEDQTARSITEGTYQVQEGDHLWDIALRAYGDGYQWVKIAQANNLDNPNVIHQGNNLSIPR